MAWLERFAEVNGQDWHPVGTPAFVAAGCVSAVFCFLANTGERRVFVPDSANLAFHEAGHPIFGLILGERICVNGGTLGQLAFPLAAGEVKGSGMGERGSGKSGESGRFSSHCAICRA